MIHSSSVDSARFGRRVESLHAPTFVQKARVLTGRVYQAALGAFRGLGRVLCFPFRYIGAKDWSVLGATARAVGYGCRQLVCAQKSDDFWSAVFRSGYQRSAKSLTPEQGLRYLKYAATCPAVQHGEAEWVKPFGLQVLSAAQLFPEQEGECLFDRQTGLKAMVTLDGDQVNVAFGAMYSHRGLVDNKEFVRLARSHYMVAVGEFAGFEPRIYTQAVDWVQRLEQHPMLVGKTFSLSGSCFGGSIAQFVALRLGKHAAVFNSWPMGPGLQWALGIPALKGAESLIHLVSCEGDFVSDAKKLGFLGHVASAVGLKVVGNFGQRYTFTTYGQDAHSKHTNFFGGLLSLVGRRVWHSRDIPQGDPCLSQPSPWDVDLV